MTDIETKLDRCPFCGGIARVAEWMKYGQMHFTANCTKCDATATDSRDALSALKAWNRRVHVNAQPVRLSQHADLHPATADLIDRFTAALRDKLLAAQRKYGYADNWQREDWMDECRVCLREHLEKGDPRDVAAYCAFLWHHGASTTAKTLTQLRADCEAADSAQPVSAPAGWPALLAKEMRAKVEECPEDIPSRFVLYWADFVASRDLAAAPPEGGNAN